MKGRSRIRRRTLHTSSPRRPSERVTRSNAYFYHDGVKNANKLSEPQSDDCNLVKLWSELAERHNLDLVVCVAAALRRASPLVGGGEPHLR